MYRIALPGGLAVLLSGMLAWADNPAALRETLALQEAMQSAIQDAEPAIACILVSRSEDYIKLGETPPPDGSGKLGRYSLRGGKDGIEQLDLANAGTVPETYGSGVVIDPSGLILTNEHVIRDATKIFVRLPGQKGSYADIHAADPRSDLAVLRLLDPPAKLKAIKLGDGGKVKKGQFVISVANPFAAGFRDGSPSASWGIISNLRRRPASTAGDAENLVKPLHHHGTLLQTDARLNIGCSGGALIDLKGELIGLTTAAAALTGSETAGGFAIPIDVAIKRIIEVLKRGEEVEYGFLGVSLPTQERPGPNGGIQISGTVAASPAAAKGLEDRDVILSINGTPINDYHDLFLTVSTVLAGNEARIEVLRGSGLAPRIISVTLDKSAVAGKFIAAQKPTPVRGLRVDYLSVLMQTLRQTKPDGISHGVVIREVQSGSEAAAAQLKVNDIITHVKGQPVRTPAEFYRRMQMLAGPVELTLANSYKATLSKER
jgi:S1-C subfamily serine protease